MTCAVLCVHHSNNSYLHNYTYITCHTKQTPIAICNSPLLHSYMYMYILFHKNCLFFDTDNMHCLDIYYHLKVPKVLMQYILFKDTLLQSELHV